jgi:hypothetical protein
VHNMYVVREVMLAEYRLEIVNTTANLQIAKLIAFNFNYL